MDANAIILGGYVVTAAAALGCVALPGAGLTGRLLCGGTGLAVGGATAMAYLAHRAPLTHPTVMVVPAALLAYIIVTVFRRKAEEHAELFTTAHRPARGPAVAAGPALTERRGPGRPVLPGEYGGVPINHQPPPHDPWAALYASVERELLRDSAGRHRPSASATPTQPLPPVGRQHPTAYAARQAAYAARQAEFTAWQTVVDAERPGPG